MEEKKKEKKKGKKKRRGAQYGYRTRELRLDSLMVSPPRHSGMNWEIVECEKNHSTNNSFELEKGQIHSGITLTVCDERIAEIAFEASISLASFLKKERSTGIAKHSIFF